MIDSREFADFPDTYVLQGHDKGSTFIIDMFSVPESVRKTGESRKFYNAFERWCTDGSTSKICLLAVDAGSGQSKGFWELMDFSYTEKAEQEFSTEQYWMEKVCQ